jgi:hypothetical protein
VHHGEGVAAGLARRRSIIACDSSIPSTRTPVRRERQGEAPGADRQLERGALARQLGEPGSRPPPRRHRGTSS